MALIFVHCESPNLDALEYAHQEMWRDLTRVLIARRGSLRDVETAFREASRLTWAIRGGRGIVVAEEREQRTRLLARLTHDLDAIRKAVADAGAFVWHPDVVPAVEALARACALDPPVECEAVATKDGIKLHLLSRRRARRGRPPVARAAGVRPLLEQDLQAAGLVRAEARRFAREYLDIIAADPDFPQSVLTARARVQTSPARHK